MYSGQLHTRDGSISNYTCALIKHFKKKNAPTHTHRGRAHRKSIIASVAAFPSLSGGTLQKAPGTGLLAVKLGKTPFIIALSLLSFTASAKLALLALYQERLSWEVALD